MCIAIPMRIAEIVDRGRRTVRLIPDAAIAADRACDEVVSAALLATSADELADLVGRWGIAHSGFLLSLLDDDDARSRLDCFRALDGLGDPTAFDRAASAGIAEPDR
jgi:hydrogenase maturation factor